MAFGGEGSWSGGKREGKQYEGYASITPPSVSVTANYNPSVGVLDTFMINTPQDDFTTYASDRAHGPELSNWPENLNPGEFMPAPFTNQPSFGEDLNPTALPTLFLPKFAPPPCHPSRRAPKDGWSPDEDNFLVGRRKDGRGFSQIGQEMFAKYGVYRSDNCLVKRLQKIQGQYLEPLPMAMKNRMPELLEILKDEMDKLGLDGVSGDDKEVLNQVMQDLPRLLPKFVQNRVTNTRKALLNTSLSRT